jgi:hypothetical protein
VLGFGWRRWRFCDLGDEVGRRSLRESVYKHANKRYLDEDVEAQTETEKYASAVLEPQLLLVLIVADTCKVGFELEDVRLCIE